MVGGSLVSGDPFAIMGSGIGAAVALLITAFSLISLIAGIALLRKMRMAPTFALIPAAISLFNAPFGTLIGLYAFWIVLRQPGGSTLSLPA